MPRITVTIALATLVAGTLDLLSAFVVGGIDGRTPVYVMQSVASGPFGRDIARALPGGALLGLAVHFAIMTVMVGVFVVAAERFQQLVTQPYLAGTAYGILVYFSMYWIVLPLRWPGLPTADVWSICNALFSHVFCVGIPIALIARHRLVRTTWA